MTKMTISDLEFVQDRPSAQHKLRGGAMPAPPVPPIPTIDVKVAVQPFVAVEIAVDLGGVQFASASGVAAAGGAALSLNGVPVVTVGIG